MCSAAESTETDFLGLIELPVAGVLAHIIGFKSDIAQGIEGSQPLDARAVVPSGLAPGRSSAGRSLQAYWPPAGSETNGVRCVWRRSYFGAA